MCKEAGRLGMASTSRVIRVGDIEQRILLVRGEKAIVDADLAAFYGVATRRLNEQVKRNARRFPRDFVFQLTPAERLEVIAKCDNLSKLKFSKGLPYAFTEHGALMAANVLKTARAVEMSVLVVRAFVRLRELLATHRELGEKLRELDRRVSRHDVHIRAIITAIRKLMTPAPVTSRRRIGFHGEK